MSDSQKEENGKAKLQDKINRLEHINVSFQSDGESAEVKGLKNLIAVTSDPSLKKTLEVSLANTLQRENENRENMTVEDGYQALHDMGYDDAFIIRLACQRLLGSLKSQIKRAK